MSLQSPGYGAVSSSRWLKLAIGVVSLAVLGIGGLFVANRYVRAKPAARLLQVALADQFNSTPDSVIPNLPSRAGRYPGAVLAVTEKGAELLVRSGERPEKDPGVSGSLQAVQLADRSVVWQLTGKLFGGELQGEGLASVEVDLENLRIFEAEAATLAEALRSDESVNRARSTGQSVTVVTRAYEAIPVITVRQGSAASVEEWAEIESELTGFTGEVGDDHSVVFRSKEPQVVAYETSEVRLIAGNFSDGQSRLELKRRPGGPGPRALPSPADFGGVTLGKDVQIAAFASSTYVNAAFGDLPEAVSSANLVGELFRELGARQLDTGLMLRGRLTTEAFAAARARLLEQVRASSPAAVVFYYAGHAVAGEGGSQYLVMGDYKGTLAEDLAQSSPFVPPADESSPLAGSNLEDLMKVVAAASQELATSVPGLVAVADLHREFSAAGVPFALVIDGCYEAEAMDELRQQLSLTAWGDHFGEQHQLGADTRAYQEALRAYGEAPYLRGSNPVIFSARPGTLAVPVRHPAFESDLVPKVAPLAAKFLGTYLNALESQESLSLGLWLRRITDFAGTGELSVRGSISWSDFDALRQLPLLRF